jgi:alpha-1,3-rhamnosyl/mannosyltransferase
VTVRVGVNLTWIAPGRVGGSEEYLVRQLLGLPSEGFGVELFGTARLAAAHPALAAKYPIEISPISQDNRALRIAMEHTWLASRTRRCDVVHHGGGTAPMIGRRPIVLTVHDLQYLTYPDYFSEGRRRYLDLMVKRSVRRAGVVATPSSFVRATVLEAFDVDPSRVVVVPHGIPDVVRPSDDEILVARRRHRIADRPYLLYPAITHPHKRHDVLVRMLEHLPDVDLVLLGGRGRGEGALEEALAVSPVRDRVVRPGRVPDAERDALLAGAEALVFPSEYEGFGAPLVEAMALGVPVVGFAHPAICEVVGDAGVLVDVGAETPGAAGVWATAVHGAIDRREELVARGHRRRSAYTLDVSGNALAGAYRLAAEIGAVR